jgi:hypothetical protein
MGGAPPAFDFLQRLHAPGFLAGLPGGLLFPQTGTTAQFAGFFVVLMGTQFFLHAAAFDQFLEPAQGQTDWFFVMNTHPQAHSSSFVRILIPKNRFVETLTHGARHATLG